VGARENWELELLELVNNLGCVGEIPCHRAFVRYRIGNSRQYEVGNLSENMLG
jgi:hypothetical protein